jgi:5-methylcytosine-specific restriction endonuclease McrA
MRTEFSAKIKLAAFQRCNGACEMPGCTAKLRPGKFTYDHCIPDQMGGAATLDNCQVICRECDRDKTAKDMGVIAKAKRRERKFLGIRNPKGRPIPGSKASGIRKRLNGNVERWQ